MSSKAYLVISLPALIIMMALHTISASIPAQPFERRPWILSLFSGISVSYIFVHLLPDIVHYVALTQNLVILSQTFTRQLIFLTMLLGFVSFYVMEAVAVQSRRRGRTDLFHRLWSHAQGSTLHFPWNHEEAQALREHSGFGHFDLPKQHVHAPEEIDTAIERLKNVFVQSGKYASMDVHGDVTGVHSFWTHIAFFGVYNFIIGYLIPSKQLNFGVGEAYLFTVAIGLHMFVNDLALATHHRVRYTRFGRWLIVSLIAVGWLVGFFWEIPAYGLALMNGFVGGATILNTTKEELPESKDTNLIAFLGGAGAYSLLLVFLK